jgi:hypothetical protein
MLVVSYKNQYLYNLEKAFINTDSLKLNLTGGGGKKLST